MSIFTRVRDIISSNINSMLDKAEDPEKMVKMIIREMEDTLVEVKASCAGAMATKKKIQRDLDEVEKRSADWSAKAELAVSKGREDLAREALMEKRRHAERVESLKKEQGQCDALVEQYKHDIVQLEDKLSGVREKQRVLVQRHIRAQHHKSTEQKIRKVDTADALARFESFEHRVERMEAEGDVVNMGKKPNLDDEFAKLGADEDIEKELQALKQKNQGGGY
jgi:phage shock protein A